MEKASSSLKATTAEDDNPIAVLKRAQADYESSFTRFRTWQRSNLQEIFKGVRGLIVNDEACGAFVSADGFADYANDPPTERDRGDIWFHGVAFVYRATTRAARQTASKHASGLRLLYEENVDPDEVAETIKKRGGIQRLASEAAAPGRIAADGGQSEQEESREEIDPYETGVRADTGSADTDAAGGKRIETTPPAGVQFQVSAPILNQIRELRGTRIKLIGWVPEEASGFQVKILKVAKLKAEAS